MEEGIIFTQRAIYLQKILTARQVVRTDKKKRVQTNVKPLTKQKDRPVTIGLLASLYSTNLNSTLRSTNSG